MSEGPSWYDILGVDPSASPEQIKAAWRAATDKFEPGSGQSQFRLFNEAADVLLDPERRRAYDAGLERAERGPAQPEPDQPARPHGGAEGARPRTEEVGPSGGAAAEPAPKQRLSLAVPALAVLVVLALVAVGVFGVLLKQRSDDAGVGYFQGITEGDAQARADAASSAGAAAERALAAALSYDYRRMPADRARALGFMSKRYGKEFAETFDKLLTAARAGQPNNVVKTKTVVKASVVAVGAMNPTASSTDRVRVLAWVNQVATKGDRSPTVFRNRVAATMVRQGNTWVIDGLDSY